MLNKRPAEDDDSAVPVGKNDEPESKRRKTIEPEPLINEDLYKCLDKLQYSYYIFLQI